MESVAAFLKWIFTYLFYPGLIIGIFMFIIGTVVVLYHKTDNIRIILAAILPIILLVFVVISDANEQSIKTYLIEMQGWPHFVAGAILGMSIIEIGNIVSRKLEPVSVALYCLYLSLIGMFLLFCIMTTAIQDIHTLLFVLVIAGGLHAIFRGIPGFNETSY